MKETISVDYAILKGKLIVLYFKLFIFFIFIVFGILSVTQFAIHFAVGLLGGVIVGYIFMKIYWKYASKSWQLWAFETVSHVHELKRKAIDLDLINNNFILDQEMVSKDMIYVQKVNFIRKRFEVPDKHYDDLSIPKEVRIFVSKPISFFFFILGLGLISSVFYMYFKFNFEIIYLILLLISGILLVFSSIKILLQKEPEIIINIDGIQIRKHNFVHWNAIQYCIVETRKMNNNSYKSNFLIIISDQLKIEHIIDGLTIKPKLIEKYIQVYINRNNKHNSNNIKA